MKSVAEYTEMGEVSEYPKLMNTVEGDVVLFKNITEGTVVYSKTNYYEPGYYYEKWIPEAFVNYTGYIQLSNS